MYVHTILNSSSDSGREGNCIQFSKQHKSICESTTINLQDDLTVIQENRKYESLKSIIQRNTHN